MQKGSVLNNPKLMFSFQIMQKEPLIRQPMYDIDMKAHKAHCRNEWEAMYRNLLYELKQKVLYNLSSFLTTLSLHCYKLLITTIIFSGTIPITINKQTERSNLSKKVQIKSQRLFQ